MALPRPEVKKKDKVKVPTTVCETHEINYASNLPGCPYCRTEEEKAADVEAADQEEIVAAAKKRPAATTSRAAATAKSRII